MHKRIAVIISALDTCSSIRMHQGICEQAEKLGYITCACVIMPSNGLSVSYCQGEYHIFEIMDFDQYDGLIVALNTISSVEIREQVKELVIESQKPVIAIDCDIEGAFSIFTQNISAQGLLVEHLIKEHHCQKINYISGPSTNGEANERKAAYCEVMEHYHLSYENRIFEGTFFVSDGKNAMDTFEKDPIANDFDAIVCANDKAALSVMEELIKRGYRIPEDCIVTGFDDIEEIKNYDPLLTSVAKCERMVGQTAINLLADFFNGKKLPGETFIDATPVFRQSCGCNMQKHDLKLQKDVNLSNYFERNIGEIFAKACIEDLIETDTFEEYLSTIRVFIERINPKEFYFILFDNYIDAFQIKNTQTIHSPLKQNSGNILIPIAYQNGKFRDLNETDYLYYCRSYTKSLDEHNNQYLCSPIHFRHSNYGMVVFSNSDFPFLSQVYTHWLSGVNTTLNGLRDRIKLLELYRKDSLTGLFNRHGLKYHWNRIEEECTKLNQPILYLFVDIDKLKYINDVFGHEQGDYTIQTVANAVLAIEDERLIAVRYGGDEFLLIGKNMNEQDGEHIMLAIDNNLQHSNEYRKKPFHISASMGYFVKRPENDLRFEDCVKIADDIMYRNKKRRKEMER